MQNDLVSIIIPCYNASEFILDTLQSILSQQSANIEVVIVNDGSNDDSEEKIKSVKDNRIIYFYQANSGVSAARNLGFQKSKGNYTIFFDADDLMTDNFIYSRLTNLKNLDFICGEVKKFNSGSKQPNHNYRGTSSNLISEILLYDQKVITCPSNYLFKTNFLKLNHLTFNTKLSSTADRYFLLECAKYGTFDFAAACTPLLYRVSQNSMSNLLSKKLVSDNELYYYLLEENNLIPPKIRDKSLFLGYYILCGANNKIQNRLHSIKYGLMAFFRSPLNFMKNILSLKNSSLCF